MLWDETPSTSFLLIKDQINYYYTFEMSAAYFLVNVVVWYFAPFPNFYFVVFLGSVAKHLESANTMFSFIWWIIGFYWVSAGGQALAQDSPQLYWFVLFHSHFQVVQISFHLWCIDLLASQLIFTYFSLNTFDRNICDLQVMYSLSWFWCFLCRFLCCAGLCHWYRCLLLSSMYHCTSLCCCRPGDFLFNQSFVPCSCLKFFFF